jgi:uncharacterized protein GlcG (DUF336 family)
MTKGRSARRVVGTALIGLGLSAGGDAQLTAKRALTLEGAKTIAAAAVAEARKNQWNMIIAVVDDGANLMYLERMDGAQIGSIEIAQLKARSAVKFKRMTKEFGDRLAAGADFLLSVPDLAPFDGGVPIMVGGECVGAVGVSGATAEQDGHVARAAAAIAASWK